MKRFLLTVLAVLAGTLCVYAQRLRDIDIRAELLPDGSARITQVWDATVVDGTEMYNPTCAVSSYSSSSTHPTMLNDN